MKKEVITAMSNTNEEVIHTIKRKEYYYEVVTRHGRLIGIHFKLNDGDPIGHYDAQTNHIFFRDHTHFQMVEWIVKMVRHIIDHPKDIPNIS